MNAAWVKNVKFTSVPVLSEFQSKSFKQFKQWTTGFQMLIDANESFAQDLKKVSKEFRNKIQEGHLDYRLKDSIGNFCKLLDNLSKTVASIWQDYASTVNPYHEYSSISDAKEKEIEKKRQKSAKVHEDMKQKLDMERKKYEKSFREFNTCLQKFPQDKQENTTRLVKSSLNQAHSRMDVASTKYQSQHLKEMQRRKDFKEEMAKLRLEWLENEEKKLNCLIKAFEDTIKRLAKTSFKVNSENTHMFDECIACFVNMDTEQIIQTRLRQRERECHFHEYKADDGIVTLDRRISMKHLMNKPSKESQEDRNFDWTICHGEECTADSKGETSVDKGQDLTDNQKNRDNSDLSFRIGRILNQIQEPINIGQSNSYYERNRILPKKNGFFEPDNVPGFQKSP